MKLIKFTLALFTFAALLPQAHADANDTMNIMIDPLALVLGPNASVEFRVGDQWTVGPELAFFHFNLSGVNVSGGGVGVGANYYFDKAFESGWFAHGGLGYSRLHLKTDEDTFTNTSEVTADTSNFTFTGLAGYHWFWGNTFNLRLGAGLAVNTAGHVAIKDSDGNKVDEAPIQPVGLALNASIGWTF